MSTEVVVALIAAIPGTIAAVAAIKAAYRTNTSNGHTMGHLVERMDAEVNRQGAQLASLEAAQQAHNANLKLHRQETEANQ